MKANTAVTAAFALKTYAITASAGNGGSISPSGGITVNQGASQTFTITPTTGYQIASVTVDGVSQGAIGSYTFTNVTAAHAIQAAFSILSANTYALTVSETGIGSGTVTNSPTGTAFTAGTVVCLTAVSERQLGLYRLVGGLHRDHHPLQGNPECQHIGDGRLRP